MHGWNIRGGKNGVHIMDICTHLAAVVVVVVFVVVVVVDDVVVVDAVVVVVVAAVAVAVAHVVEPRRLQQNEKANLL